MYIQKNTNVFPAKQAPNKMPISSANNNEQIHDRKKSWLSL